MKQAFKGFLLALAAMFVGGGNPISTGNDFVS